MPPSGRIDNVMKMLFLAASSAVLLSTSAIAADIEGPGRFCGYSPIIDLLPGEKVTILEAGIHLGSFRWEGAFGSLDVTGVGWAGRPKGRVVKTQTSTKPARFASRRVDRGYQIAIWNLAHGAAYFTSPAPFTASQMEAISRVSLFEEGQTPLGCDLRTMFSWD